MKVCKLKKFTKAEQRLLAIWAADCAKRVLPLFEKAYPKDNRPRKAIESCRKWVKTGIFKMADIRGVSLSAHAAARKAKKNPAACFAARAAGQAVATAHVPEHAFGAPYYAIKAIAAANPKNPNAKALKEYKWQKQHLPKKFRKPWLDWQKKRLPKGFKRLFDNS